MRNWDTPHPKTAGECVPPPPQFWGEGLTRWRERSWESPNSDEGTYIVVLFIHASFVAFLLYLAGPNIVIKAFKITRALLLIQVVNTKS